MTTNILGTRLYLGKQVRREKRKHNTQSSTSEANQDNAGQKTRNQYRNIKVSIKNHEHSEKFLISEDGTSKYIVEELSDKWVRFFWGSFKLSITREAVSI